MTKNGKRTNTKTSRDVDKIFRDASFYNGYDLEDDFYEDDDDSEYSDMEEHEFASHSNGTLPVKGKESEGQSVNGESLSSPISHLALPPLMPPLSEYICKCCGEKEKGETIKISEPNNGGEEKKEDDSSPTDNKSGDPILRNDPEYGKVRCSMLFNLIFLMFSYLS